MIESEPKNEFTVLDWIGCVLTAIMILILFGFPVTAAAFSEMFEDFGGELPTLTAIVLIPWFAPLLGALAACIFVMQWIDWAKHHLKRRRILVAGSFLFALISFCICRLALYLPIFKMAGALQ